MVYFIDATSGQSTRHQVVFLTLCLFFQALHLPITVMLALLLWRKPITQEPMRSINELVHRNIWRVDDSCWRCQPLEHSNPDKAREWPRASIGQQNIGATISSWSDKKKMVRIYLQHKSSSVASENILSLNQALRVSLPAPSTLWLEKCADFYIFCWLRNILYLWNNLHNFSTNSKEDTASISILFHN